MQTVTAATLAALLIVAASAAPARARNEPGNVIGWTETQVLDAFGSASSRQTNGDGETWYYDHTTVGTVKIFFVRTRVVDVAPGGAVDALRMRPVAATRPVARQPTPYNSKPGNVRRGVGVLTTVTGIVLMATAYDWDGGTYCEGVGSHRIDFQDQPDKCVTVTRSTTTIRDPRAWVDAELARPRLLWAGSITAAAGLVLALLPVRHGKFVDVSVAPDGVRASKTITFGK
jgi:hypothetical protein